MSEIMTIKGVKMTDVDCIKAACQLLECTYLGTGEYRVFNRNIKGIGIQVPGMHYTAVVDSENDTLTYDVYQSTNHKQAKTIVNRLPQEYTRSVLEQTFGCTAVLESSEYDKEENLVLEFQLL